MSKKKTNQPRKKKQGSDNSKKQETKQRDNQIVKNVSVKIIVIKPKSWWHIRKYYKSGHGALIVGESGPSSDDDYGFFNITKNPPDGYAYFETEKPINNGNQKSHVRLYLQKGKKKRFSKWIMNYEFSTKDYEYIDIYLKNKEKKR